MIWDTPRKNPHWKTRDASYSRSSSGGGAWNKNRLPERWTVNYKELTFKINEFLKAFFKKINVDLIDFKIEFGKTPDGQIILADEISPDTCRLWDATTHEKLDKDRFRRDMGGVEDAYQEMMRRIFG